MLKLIQILTLALLYTSQEVDLCSNGCLICKNSRCQFCDFLNQYYLSGGTCSQTSKENCQYMNQIGICFKCNVGHFLDTSNNLCVVIDEEHKIDHCLYQSSLLVCSLCEEGYFLNGATCEELSDVISNCKYQMNNEKCDECQSGYLVNTDKEECMEANIQNCQVYDNIQCEECIEDHILDKNYYIKHFSNIDSSNVSHNLQEILIGGLSLSSFIPYPCMKIEDENCLQFENFGKCKICSSGYYLNDEKNCVKNSYEIVEHCIEYDDQYTCAKCEIGYFVQQPNLCAEITTINNCATYSQTARTVTCLSCKFDYFLTNNQCNLRTASFEVEFCEEFNPYEDNCISCQNNKITTSDNLRCLDHIINCETYQFSSKGDDELNCDICVSGFYLNEIENTCDTGTIDQCQKYKIKSNVCQSCINGFYLKDQECIPHKNIEFCEEYDELQENLCVHCQNDSFVFIQTQGCAQIENDISFCAQYSDPNTCFQCDEGYELISNECEVINPNEHCLKKLEHHCIKCSTGYYLNGHLCFLEWNIIEENCQEIDNNTCAMCQENFYPKNYKNNFICLNNEETDIIQIPNCLKYKEDKCQLCQESYFLSEDQLECVVSCGVGETPILVDYEQDSETDNIISDILYKKCRLDGQTGLTNCQYGVINNDESYACMQCKAGYLQSETLYITIYDIHTSFSVLNQQVNLFNNYPTYSCIQITNQTYYPGGDSPSPNCRNYNENSGNFYCRTCIHGYSGVIEDNGGINYINCSQTISDCDTTVQFNNFDDSFPQWIYNYVSCHQCLNNGKIPVLHADDGLEYKNYNISELTPSGGTGGLMVDCREPTAEGLDIPSHLFQNDFVENCAGAVVWVDRSKQHFDIENVANSITCLACKPGYREIGSFDHILACDKIDHCDLSSSNLISGCSQCEPGYTWQYDKQNVKVRYDRCVDNSKNPHCLIYSEEEIGIQDAVLFNQEHFSKHCYVCKKGFSINQDGICELINSPKCSNQQYVDFQHIIGYEFQIGVLAQYLYPKGAGCLECDTSFFAVKVETDLYTCTFSSLIASQNHHKSLFIDNCLYYGNVQDELICKQCQLNYVISEDQKSCISESIFTDCVKINNTITQCLECNQGTVLINNLCESKTIENCSTYEYNSEYQICLACNEYYYLDSNKCKFGVEVNCKSYDSDGLCEVCEEGYARLITKSNQRYCIQINPFTNCKVLNQNKINDFEQLSCDQCDSGFVISQNQNLFQKSICMNLNKIENCESYHKGLTILSSTLLCEQCLSGYYMKNNNCLPLTKNVEYCQEYSDVANVCVDCSEGFYLDVENQKCVEYPTGVIGCIIYEDKDTCLQCNSEHYLVDNQCIQLSNDDRVDYCIEYNETPQCQKCLPNYYLELTQNECKETDFRNCEEIVDMFNCQKCIPGYGLVIEEATGYNICQIINKQNCLITTNEYPFDCTKCKPGYYVAEGYCYEVHKSIDQCVVYETSLLCSQCEQNYVLSLDKQECKLADEFQNQPSRCANLQFTADPVCIACDFGFYFENGECVLCQSQNYNAGCLMCDPSEADKCLICREGYYQNSQGQCNQNSGF